MMERSKSSPQRPDYLSEDTITAPASPAGGAVGLVRISGPESLNILRDLCGGASACAEPRHLFRTRLQRQDGSSLDDAMAVWFKGPASFTGEDVVELFLHGSAFVLSDVLQEIQRLGARPALPGEFSFRAVRNGKMDLNQAQAVADLVAAGNRGAVELALEKLQGTQSRLVREMAEELRTLATLSELGIDFADQDVEEVSLPRLKERAQAVLESLSRLEGSFERGLRIQEGISVSFIGKPNAGKSSFFNALLGEDRSIVTEIAGTTRDIVREKINLQGQRSSITLRVEDTAGIRSDATDQVEEIGIGRSLESARSADLILLILDGMALTAHPEQERSDTLSLWKSIGGPRGKVMGIVTRADQMTEKEQKSACDWVSKILGIPCHSVSSMTHQNLPETVQAVVTFCERLVIRDPGEVLLTRMEQVESVRAASARLRASLDTMEESLFSSDVRHALDALSPVIGATPTDDLLGRIFSQFCIGK